MQTIESILRQWQRDYLVPPGRTGILFREHLANIQRRTDGLFYYLLLIQYPAAIGLALLWSPFTWVGTQSSVHFHVWLAVIFGGILTSLPVYLIRSHPAHLMTRHVIAVAQMMMGALLIHLSGGRIETHFHIFGSLAFLAFYRDLGVLATATVVVASDHLLRGIFLPESVYGLASASSWRFFEHALWVTFENVFLALTCIQGRAQISATASQQAQLEEVNETIEAAVQARTRELSLRTEELAAARDAALESTRLKSQFLANVSHEIRTPMNGVLGMTSLLLDTRLTPDQRDCATTVQRSAEGLLTIINDILDFSKIEAGKLALERVDFILRNEVEDVVRLLAEPAERKRLEFVCEIDEAVPSVVTGDAGRIRQILVNLVGNAIKFTEKGEVTIRVSQRDRIGNTSRVRFEISDTGIGIAEQARHSLFQAFVQVDGSTTRKHEGTGLGLAISMHLVQLMGGRIEFDSIPGSGSTFWFEIPLEVISGSDELSLAPSRALEGLRVLVVDDNSTNRDVILRTVAAWGMLAEEAANGQQALMLLESAFERDEPFDVALLDLQMPEMDGIQLARKIREREHFRATQLLMLTSMGQRAVCSSLKHSGIAACMVKPARREHLFLMIARICGKSDPEASNNEGTAPIRPVLSQAGGLSILVAEDNLVNQRVLTRMLERLGHRYELVSDGAAAIEAVKRSSYDVVLMDCQMPRVDGFKATAEIRRLPGAVGQIPIIAVTANAMSGDRERCVAAGMTGYIAKPIRLDALAEAISTVPIPAG